MNDLVQKFQKIIADLRSGASSLRTGRATPALVENIAVEAYGANQPLKSLAAISTPESRQILIQPWDKSLLPAIEKAIMSSQVGLQPIADKDAIRLSLPVLTEERKQQLVKILREKLEEARIKVRQIRDSAMKDIDGREKAKEISEDEKFRRREEVEKSVGEHNKKIEELGKTKEAEIMAG